MSDLIKQDVEEWIAEVNYGNDAAYVPSDFALEFINFIKLVNGSEGEENLSPVVHFKMLDKISGKRQNIANLCHRGMAKTTLLGEYLFLYLAVYGAIPGFGKIPLAIYVSDSIENGVKNMRKNLEFRWENSDFLKMYVPNTRFTDIRWEFDNISGTRFIVKGYGAKTGVRGAKEMGVRPTLAVLDDLISDEDARSATVISSVEDTVYKAVDYALHTARSKIIWSGTPFNARDPLYKAVESGAWYVNVYPVCEEFPCDKKDFKGSWEDKFTYEYVQSKYVKALKAGKIDTFNQELMLRIISEEDRLIKEQDIQWYDDRKIKKALGAFNIYITTDFATSAKAAADFSTIFVWGYNANGDWYWLDGIVVKQTMDKNINELFRLAQVYKPMSVGIEVSGQQGGFIPWIKEQMLERTSFFNLASDKNSGEAGIRPTTDKMTRFQIVVPWFKMGKMYFPEHQQDTAAIREIMGELRLTTTSKFQSKHDDCIDPISMLSVMNAWKPSDYIEANQDDRGIWTHDVTDNTTPGISSYLV
jgi:predicted phage terminase large subunit-like protein